ncbi:hypothetical protein [Kitasatospora brasiliensis]|uniref:hypothetical protein n=1 Tax=Kitasatospora brasiliensis TaxID=3058040 RepID=UPI002930890E|nr:hypothetical protein [Kitasatospora sp. K002]
MSVRRLMATAATATLALVPVALATPAAHAQNAPVYTCDVVIPDYNLGAGNCVASGGAPAEGPFTGALIIARTGDPIPSFIFCEEGIASTPGSVMCLKSVGT